MITEMSKGCGLSLVVEGYFWIPDSCWRSFRDDKDKKGAYAPLFILVTFS